ncbi:plasmid replication initiator TrfA [Methylolobus aquaticus]
MPFSERTLSTDVSVDAQTVPGTGSPVDHTEAVPERAAVTAGVLAERIASIAAAKAQCGSLPRSMPSWPDVSRGAPNVLLRSALFAGVQGRQRQVFKKRTLLASTQDIELKLQGVQLDQSDLDVWLQILHLARHQLPGYPVTFKAHSLLKAMGRGISKPHYAWLADSLARLSGALVEVTFKGRHTFGDHLLRYYRDEDTQTYVVELTLEMCRLFASGYTYLEWEQRQQLRRKPLALWLHGYLCSHATPYPVKVTTLHRLSGSSAQNLRDFKLRVRSALQDLVAIGALAEATLTDDGRVMVKHTTDQ